MSMLAAIAAPSAGWQFALFALAGVIFIVAAAARAQFDPPVRVNLVAAGLAVLTLLWAWQALAQV